MSQREPVNDDPMPYAYWQSKRDQWLRNNGFVQTDSAWIHDMKTHGITVMPCDNYYVWIELGWIQADSMFAAWAWSNGWKVLMLASSRAELPEKPRGN